MSDQEKLEYALVLLDRAEKALEQIEDACERGKVQSARRFASNALYNLRPMRKTWGLTDES